MFILISLIGLISIVIITYSFIALKINIDTGKLLGFFLFFDIYAFFLSQIITFVTPLLLLVAVSVIVIIISSISDYDRFKLALKQKEGWLWIIFFIYIICSIIWTNNIKYASFKIQIFIIRALLPGLAIYFSYQVFHIFSWRPVIINGLFYVIAFLLLGQTSDLYLGRQSLEGANPIWIARTSLLFVTIAFFYPGMSRIKRLFLSAPGLYAGYMAQSKGPFVALFSAIIYKQLSLFIKTKYNENKHKIIISLKIIILVSISIIVVIIILSSSGVLEGTRYEVLFSYKKLFSEPTVLDRIVRYMKAIKLFSKNPVLGTGLGGFSVLDERDYPHNLILEIGSELGIIGLLIWFIVIMKSINLAKNNKIILVIFIQALIYSFFSGDLAFNYEYVIISFLAIGMYASKTVLKPQKAKETYPFGEVHT